MFPVSKPNKEPAMHALAVANISLPLKTSFGIALTSALVRNFDIVAKEAKISTGDGRVYCTGCVVQDVSCEDRV